MTKPNLNRILRNPSFRRIPGWIAVLAYALWTFLPHGVSIYHQHEDGHSHIHTEKSRHFLKLKNQVMGLTYGQVSAWEGSNEVNTLPTSHATHAPSDSLSEATPSHFLPGSIAGNLLRPGRDAGHEHILNPALAGETSLSSPPHSLSFHAYVVPASELNPDTRSLPAFSAQARAPPAV